MAEYIELEAVLKIIDDNCPHDKGGYNTEEEMGAGAACYYIRKAVNDIPTADVAPRAEVAREIFEEIENEINNDLKNNKRVLPQIEISNALWNRVSGKINALQGVLEYIAELKEKYTDAEAEPPKGDAT